MKTKCITRFKLLRTQYKLSTPKFAKLLNMKSPTSITNIENGRALPSFEMFVKIAKLFGISIDWLMGVSEIQYNEPLIAAIENELKTKPFIKKYYYKLDLETIKFYNSTIRHVMHHQKLQTGQIKDKKTGEYKKIKVKSAFNIFKINIDKEDAIQ